MPHDFDRQEYWHERFINETKFDWLISSTTFMTILEPILSKLPTTARILQLGSGTSDLHNHLRSRGFLDVTNIDYEPLAVERGRQLEESVFNDVKMRYLVADATKMDPIALCAEGPFDLVIDKSTADAISCGGDLLFFAMLDGLRRCMADRGRWVSMSYSSSRFNVEDNPFRVKVLDKVATPKRNPNDPDIFHWCYILSL